MTIAPPDEGTVDAWLLRSAGATAADMEDCKTTNKNKRGERRLYVSTRKIPHEGERDGVVYTTIFQHFINKILLLLRAASGRATSDAPHVHRMVEVFRFGGVDEEMVTFKKRSK